MANLPTAALRMTLLGSVAILVVFAAAPASSSPSRSTPLRGVSITGDPVLPSGCNSPQDTAVLISNFLDAFNRGDSHQLGRFFGSDLMWYSVTEPQGNFVAYNQGDLLKYFEGRHAQHERLVLVSIDVRGPGWHGGVDIVYTINRQADDLGLQGQSLRG